MPKAPRIGGGDVTLDDAVFAAKFNGPLVHEVVRAELNALRQGTAATKTRGNVRGGGAKPWRQKGTGRARAGSSRSPIWKGGGIVFGPSPRHYTFKVNRKARRAALRSALSVHADRGSIAVFDAASFGERRRPSRPSQLLNDWGQPLATLVLLDADEATAGLSFRNMWRVIAMPVEDAGVADVIGAASLLISEAALEQIYRPRQRRDRTSRRRSRVAMDASQVIIRPVVSEKSFVQAEIGKYTFRVHADAHKTQIRQAVEQLFDVKVRDVRTVSVKSKPKRRGVYAGRTRTWKKAIVQLAAGRHDPDLPGPGGH